MSDQGSAAPAAPAATSAASTPVESQVQGSSDLSADDLAAIVGEDSSGSAGGESATKEVKAAEDAVKNAKGKDAKIEAKKELDKAKRQYKLKVDGQEMNWEGTDEDIVKALQMQGKSQKEIQASSQMKREVAEFLQALKTDPRRVLSDPTIGVDVLEFAKQIINDKIQDDLKSPEQLEKERLSKELEDLRNQHKTEKEHREKADYQRLVAQAEADIEEKVQEALETSGLPKSPYVLKRMADVMLSALEAKKDISPKQAMAIVKKEMNKDMKDMFAASPEDLLEELLGSDNIKRINKRQLDKVRKQAPVTASSVKDTGVMKTKEDNNSNKAPKIKISDWLKAK